jgi:putative transposase
MTRVTRSFRIRVYPNASQRRHADRWFGAARWLWNTTLAIRSEGYRHCRLRLYGKELSRWLTQWKQTAGHEWLADVPATCFTQCLRDQDQAFANFFAKRARYPRFKRKDTAASLRFQDVSENAWRRGELKLPKLGVLKLAEELPQVMRPDMVTLSRESSGRHFVSFSAEVDMPGMAPTGQQVGVDLGITQLATLSTGVTIANPKRYAARLRYLRQQQRCLRRRQKGSRRHAKQRLRLARAHARVAQQRRYATHQLTTRLVRENDVICIEDLNVRAMARGLHARAIHDAAFGEIRRQLRYKCAWYGRTLVEVDRFYPSSKTCSTCGHRLDELRLDVREWTCPKCGCEHDRDVNAAKNLLAEGLRQLAGRDGRDLCVDARGPCAETAQLQVLAGEARSGQPKTARMERAEFG